MSSRQEITDAIDAGIAAAWPEIQARQEAYRAAHGRYFQGLCTHTNASVPADGLPAAADRLDSHPDYQTETWLDVGYDAALHEEPRAALTIDQYQGPQGPGYVCVFHVKHEHDVWRREINAGPESYRDTPWQREE